MEFAIKAQSKQQQIVFSFQGAFASPTFGHYEAMRIFARKMLEQYPDAEIITQIASLNIIKKMELFYYTCLFIF